LQEAKDVAQEAYALGLQLREPGRQGVLRAHLLKVAAILAVDRLRHRSVRQRPDGPPQLFEELIYRHGVPADRA
jgi:hypothetical protein